MTVKSSNLPQNALPSVSINLDDSPEVELEPSKKKKNLSSDPSSMLEHNSPQHDFPECDCPSLDPLNNDPAEHEIVEHVHKTLFPKIGHVEYNSDLFNLHQFDYGTPEDDLPNLEIPITMPTTSSSEKIIQEKNKEIEELGTEVEEYKDLD